jgi:hypothetical protein
MILSQAWQDLGCDHTGERQSTIAVISVMAAAVKPANCARETPLPSEQLLPFSWESFAIVDVRHWMILIYRLN